MDNATKEYLSHYLVDLILQYMTGVMIGLPEEKLPNNGTFSLVEINGIKLGITCAHVFREFERRYTTNNKTVMQVGREVINPFDRLIDVNDQADIATFNFTDLEFGYRIGHIGIGTHYFAPPQWPPSEPNKGDCVGISGFPGQIKFDSNGKIFITTCSISAQPITDVNDRNIILALERDTWYYTEGQYHNGIPLCLGGMSGGPAMIFKNYIEGGVIYPEFIGIVSKQMESMDIVKITRANQIDNTGRILVIE